LPIINPPDLGKVFRDELPSSMSTIAKAFAVIAVDIKQRAGITIAAAHKSVGVLC